MHKYSSFFEFPPVIRSPWALPVLTLIRIYALNSKFKHYVTLATPRVVRFGVPERLYEKKVVPLARVTRVTPPPPTPPPPPPPLPTNIKETRSYEI